MRLNYTLVYATVLCYSNTSLINSIIFHFLLAELLSLVDIQSSLGGQFYLYSSCFVIIHIFSGFVGGEGYEDPFS